MRFRFDVGTHGRIERPERRPLELARHGVDPVVRDVEPHLVLTCAAGRSRVDGRAELEAVTDDRVTPRPRKALDDARDLNRHGAAGDLEGHDASNSTGELGEARRDEDRRRRVVRRLACSKERLALKRQRNPKLHSLRRRRRHEPAFALPVANLLRQRPRQAHRGQEPVPCVRAALDETARRDDRESCQERVWRDASAQRRGPVGLRLPQDDPAVGAVPQAHDRGDRDDAGRDTEHDAAVRERQSTELDVSAGIDDRRQLGCALPRGPLGSPHTDTADRGAVKAQHRHSADALRPTGTRAHA
jgi:hypothetical protein